MHVNNSNIWPTNIMIIPNLHKLIDPVVYHERYAVTIIDPITSCWTSGIFNVRAYTYYARIYS